MANAGLRDIFIANCLVDRLHFERLCRLAQSCKMSVGVDSREAAQALSDFLSGQNQSLEVRMEIDTGHHRCGVSSDAACDLATFLTALPSIRFKGIFTHEGHVYQPGSAEQRLARAELAGRILGPVSIPGRPDSVPGSIFESREGLIEDQGPSSHIMPGKVALDYLARLSEGG